MTHPAPKVLKSLLLSATFMVSTLALALPSPKDITAAVEQGHLAQAESMLREVIAAKPQSAKAHYELGQVLLRENRQSEAQSELLAAKAMDPSLKFASSAQQFNDILEKTQPRPVHTASAANPAAHAPMPQNSGFSLSHVWMGIAALAVMGLLVRLFSRRAPVPAPAHAAGPASAPDIAFGRGAAYPAGPVGGYGGGGHQGYAGTAPSGGSSVAGAVVGGLAGVAAGYALSKALEGDHHPAPSAAVNDAVNSNRWEDNQGLVSMDSTPPAPAFDAGSGGDDWGGNDSGSTDDTW